MGKHSKIKKKPTKSKIRQVPGQTTLTDHYFSRDRPIENNRNTSFSEVPFSEMPFSEMPYNDDSTTQMYNVPSGTHNIQATNNDRLWVILDEDTAIKNDMEHHDIKDGYRINMSNNKTIVSTINYAYYGYKSINDIDEEEDYIDYNQITNGFGFLEEASELVVHNFDMPYHINNDHTVFEQLKFADHYNNSTDKEEAAEYILNEMKRSDIRFYTCLLYTSDAADE